MMILKAEILMINIKIKLKLIYWYFHMIKSLI